MTTLYIVLWWLFGCGVLALLAHHYADGPYLQRITVGELVVLIVGPFIWPIALVFAAILFDWIDLPVFDRDWFKGDDDGQT